MSAFNYLQELDQKFSLSSGAAATDQAESRKTLHFKVGQYDFLLPLDNTPEVIMSVDYTSVPISRPWLVGVASHRGELLTLVDLKNYLFNSEPVTRLNNRKVIASKSSSLYLGIIVDQVIGIVNAHEHEERNSYPAHWDDSVIDLITGIYSINGCYYGMCDVYRIIKDKGFSDTRKVLN
jgi:chemotaxis signal transduction protein